MNGLLVSANNMESCRTRASGFGRMRDRITSPAERLLGRMGLWVCTWAPQVFRRRRRASVYVLLTTFNHAQSFTQIAPNGQKGRRYWTKLMYETRLSSHSQAHELFAATKQRVIDATKMILEIAKESADICPPLKSFLGGISALMKLCEVRFHRIAPRSR